jgi:NADH dehydrogenase
VFGQEDEFINRFARMAQYLPLLPVMRGSARFQPVFVGDVARAAAAAALDPAAYGGETYELGGPQVKTMREINQWIADQTGRGRRLIDVPDAAGRLLAQTTGWLPGAPITMDQWLMLQRDNIAAPGSKGLEAFGIAPTPMSAVGEGWLTAYRRRGRFAARQTSPY